MLAAQYPGSQHLAYLDLLHASDQEVWDYAREHGFTIVTQDSDFEELSVMRGWPPKVVIANIGNGPVRRVAMLLQNATDRIVRFEANGSEGVLRLRPKR